MVGNVMSKTMKAHAPHQGTATIRPHSGEAERTLRSVAPVLSPTVLPQPIAQAHPALARVCRLFDGVIAASSLVSNEPVLDVRQFDWTAGLRRQWRAIREDAVALTGTVRSCGIVPLRPGTAALRQCPGLSAALDGVPGLHDAAIGLLAPGTHVAARRGPTKALLTCHLGLVVPRDGDARMRVRDRIVRWAEGETLVFDDSYPHQLWNEAETTRIILRLRFARPLRQPGRSVADGVVRLLGEAA